jgi:hypothetical protein
VVKILLLGLVVKPSDILTQEVKMLNGTTIHHKQGRNQGGLTQSTTIDNITTGSRVHRGEHTHNSLQKHIRE